MSQALGLLEVAGLIRRESPESDVEYAFRHALVRDTAYGSLLLEERKALHRAVGGAMERLLDGHEDGEAAVLAHHFLAGEVQEKALDYLRLAGEAAARVYALEEALQHFGQALKLAAAGYGSDEDLIYLYERRGRMLELAARYQEAMQNYRDLESYGQVESKPKIELHGLLRQAALSAIPSAVMDQERARDLTLRALSKAKDQGDVLGQSLALWSLMKVKEYQADYPAAREEGEKALALIETVDSPEQRAFILNDLAGNYMSTGAFDRAKQVNLQAIELWQQLDNRPMLVDAYGNQTSILMLSGEFKEALAISGAARQLSEEIDNAWGKSYSRYMVYWVQFEQGDTALALETARQCVRLAEVAGFVVPLVQTVADIGLMHAMMGQFESAYQAIEKSIANTQRLYPEWVSQPQAMKVLTLTLEGRLTQAEPLIRAIEESSRELDYTSFSYFGFIHALVLPEYWIAREEWELALAASERYLDLFEHFGIEFFRYEMLRLKGSVLFRMGQVDEARAVLDKGAALADKIGSRRGQWRLQDALAAVAEAQGDGDAAKAHRRRAQEAIRYIADHTEDDGQRQSFLDRVEALSAR